KFVFDEPKTPYLQSLIPGVVELRLTIRLLPRVRGDKRKRSLVMVLGISDRGAVSGRKKTYDFGVLELDRSGSGSCFRASSSCQFLFSGVRLSSEELQVGVVK
ncbi:hypothetical protein LINPERPRIM_LOCUS21036, partial [Linum perenne]